MGLQMHVKGMVFYWFCLCLPKGAGETAQQLRALDALLKDMYLIPSAQTVAYNHLQLQFQGIQGLPLSSVDTKHTDSMHICIGKIPIRIK